MTHSLTAWFFCGLTVGACLGLVFASWCMAARQADDWHEKVKPPTLDELAERRERLAQSLIAARQQEGA